MPSGWPSAIAPPLGLTRGSSSATPSSRSTARPCEANASFSSITSICSMVRPTCCSSFLVAGAGPIPITRGATPAVAMPTIRARGVRPYCLTASALASSKAHAPSLTPEALPAVTVPSARTTPLSFASASILVARGCSSLLTVMASLFLWNHDGRDFLCERAVCLRGSSLGLAGDGKFVLIEAADLEIICDVFTGFRHGVGTVKCLHLRVRKTPADSRVVDIGVARKRAVGLAHDERRTCHRLNTTCEHELRFA